MSHSRQLTAVLTVIAILLLGGCAIIFKSISDGLKQESGITGDVIIDGRLIAGAAKCYADGKVDGLWMNRLTQGLGGSFQRNRGQSGLDDETYVVSLNAKRILVTWVTQKNVQEIANQDAHVIIHGADFLSTGDVGFRQEDAMEILRVAYPTLHAVNMEFNWKRNLCKWTLVN